MSRALSPNAARKIYNRIGKKLDTQAFYEDPALNSLLRNGAFESAHHVLEFGCGTGRLAERLLAQNLPPDARYEGCDISETMLELTRARLRRFPARVHLWPSGPDPDLASGRHRPDRVISTFVLDLLSSDARASFVDQAARLLPASGRLCVANLTSLPTGALPRVTMAVWRGLAALNPALTAGCRPIAFAKDLAPTVWTILHHETGAAYGIPWEVTVAQPRKPNID